MPAQHSRLSPSRLTLRHPRKTLCSAASYLDHGAHFNIYPILAVEQGLTKLSTRKEIRRRFSHTELDCTCRLLFLSSLTFTWCSPPAAKLPRSFICLPAIWRWVGIWRCSKKNIPELCGFSRVRVDMIITVSYNCQIVSVCWTKGTWSTQSWPKPKQLQLARARSHDLHGTIFSGMNCTVQRNCWR